MIKRNLTVEGKSNVVSNKGEYTCKLVKIIEHAPEEQSNKSDCLMFKSDNNELLFLTCSSDKQTMNHFSNLAKQLGLGDCDIDSVIEALQDTPVKLWANPRVNPNDGKTYLNISAYKPFGFDADDDME